MPLFQRLNNTLASNVNEAKAGVTEGFLSVTTLGAAALVPIVFVKYGLTYKLACFIVFKRGFFNCAIFSFYSMPNNYFFVPPCST